MKLKVDQTVYHEEFGKGVVIAAWYGRRSGENYAIKFRKGGPMGWAKNATHDISELTVKP
jgi:hypothetical protein